MIKSIRGEYFLMDELYSGSSVAAYTARTLLGDSVIVSEMVPASNAEALSGIEACKALAAADRGAAIIGVREFIHEDGRIYIVSESYAGITLREHMKTSYAFEVRPAVSLLLPLLEDVAGMLAQGVDTRPINPGNTLVSQNALKLLNLGVTGGANDTETAAEAAKFLYFMLTRQDYDPVTGATGATGATGVADRYIAQVIDDTVNGRSGGLHGLRASLRYYLNPQSSATPAQTPSAPVIAYPQANASGYTAPYAGYQAVPAPKPRKTNRAALFLSICGVLAVVGCLAGIISYLADLVHPYSYYSSSAAPAPTAWAYSDSGVYSDDDDTWTYDEYDYYDEYEYNNDIGYDPGSYLNTYPNAYVDGIYLDGMVMEHNGMVYYRAYQNGEWRLYRENAEGGDGTVLLSGYAPAFMAANDDYLFFTDCLNGYNLTYMNLDGSGTDMLLEYPSIFNVVSSDGSALYTTSEASGGWLMRIDMADFSTDYLSNFYAAETAIWDGRLYFNNAESSFELYSTTDTKDLQQESYGTACGITPYGGYIYYMDEIAWNDLPYLCRYDPATGVTDYVVYGSVYDFDIVGDKIYYIDSSDNYHIYTCDLDGGNARLLIKCDAAYIKATGNHIYYVDTSKGEILCRADLNGGAMEELEDPYNNY